MFSPMSSRGEYEVTMSLYLWKFSGCWLLPATLSSSSSCEISQSLVQVSASGCSLGKTKKSSRTPCYALGCGHSIKPRIYLTAVSLQLLASSIPSVVLTSRNFRLPRNATNGGGTKRPQVRCGTRWNNFIALISPFIKTFEFRCIFLVLKVSLPSANNTGDRPFRRS